MKARIAAILAVPSLTLFALAAVLWVRSYVAFDQWHVMAPAHELYTWSYDGAITLSLCRHTRQGFDWGWRAERDGYDAYEDMAANTRPGSVRRDFLGFAWMSVPVIGPEPGYTAYRLLRLPYWSVAIITALAPSLWLRAWVRQHHRRTHGSPARPV